MFDVRFYGLRGSYCTPGKATAGYGGSTSCVAVLKKNRAGLTVPVIIDSGNGIIKAGQDIAAGIKARTVTPSLTLLFTHLHGDHIEGTSFFTPYSLPGVHVFLGGKEAGKYPLSVSLPLTMELPFFPVKFESFPAERTFFSADQTFYIKQSGEPVPEEKAGKALQDLLFKIEVFSSSTRFHPEPGCLYFRFTDCEDGSSLACLWDIETAVESDAARSEYEALVKFAKGVDFLIHDSMYTAEEYASKVSPVKGYGHSSYDMALETARLTGAKKTAAFHYNPLHTDSFLDGLAEKYKGRLIMPRQGDTFRVG
jgi:phosphoribosyl 1,2-cyclic phosphodiesterase